MVQIVLAVAVFVLALAMVGLFAMMGELASRVSSAAQTSGTDLHPQPIEEARLGTAPADWPAELATVRDADAAHLVVFSSICATCARIASGDTGSLDALASPVAIVVSCPTREAGAEFVAKHPMVSDYPHVIDVGGAWLGRNFDIHITPGVLAFAAGALRSAYTFTDATALSHLPSHPHQEAAHVHAGEEGAARAEAAEVG